MKSFLILLLLIPFFSLAQIPDPKPDTYINDYTNHLSRDETYQLNQRILQLEKQTTVQLAVLLIDNLPDNMSLEDYAREVGNKWKVGISHNGLVYVAVLKARRQRLEVARNLEGTITDVAAANIIDELRPFLQQQDYYGAIGQLITQLEQHLGVPASDSTYANDYSSGYDAITTIADYDSTARAQEEAYRAAKAKYDHYGTYAILILILGMTGFTVWAVLYKKKYYELHTVNGVYTGIGSIYDPVDTSSGGSSGGSGFGGFGGGGGGGFSGGGASGSW